MTEQPNPADFSVNDKPRVYEVRIRIEGEMRMTIQADSLEEAGAHIPVFLAARSLSPYVTNELADGPLKPISYISGGTEVVGYQAEALPEICNCHDSSLRMAEAGECMLIYPVSVWEMGACGFALPLVSVSLTGCSPRDS